MTDSKRRSESRDPGTTRIVNRVRAIPTGFVRTYGDIDPGAPRFVGRVLRGAGRLGMRKPRFRGAFR